MKKGIFSAFILFVFFSTQDVLGQFSRPISVGAGAGGTMVWADLGNTDTRFAGYVEAEGLITPFISIGVKGEKGTLSAYGWNSDFENRYHAINANAKVRLGQFLSLPANYSYYTLGASTFSKILANIYVGAGIGVLKNNIDHRIDASYRTSIENNGGEISEDLNSHQLAIPLNIGLDIPIGRTLYGPRWAININYQQSLLPKDNVDGVINSKMDQYSYLSVGVKLALFNRN
ncbi:hypothetical protein [Sphingobacterium haloxyli]|uniref:Outer membrane protein beta-barrel domain-containing protein n=1 Tax=Sphingobacterium haloxyli TaxID=2100533 RepID=A0A2S9IYA9_9SPHI|nr:hypothetical protein [Sphingobacterium haloxyli]PRD45470.1 hypothetical protein C5745_18450 [Sphingobacterium haloxyli]